MEFVLDGTRELWVMLAVGVVLGGVFAGAFYTICRYPHLRREEFAYGESHPWLGAIGGGILFFLLAYGWAYRSVAMNFHAARITSEAVVLHYTLPSREEVIPLEQIEAVRPLWNGKTTQMIVLTRDGQRHHSIPLRGKEQHLVAKINQYLPHSSR